MDAANKISLSMAAIALGVSLWQAWTAHRGKNQQLELARRIHREKSEPYVVVDVGPDRPGSPLLVLSIENTGPTMARDVRVRVDQDLVSSHGSFTERLQRAVARTIPVLPPGRRLVFGFDVYSRRESSGLPMQFDFTVEATGPAGPVETLTYQVDLSVLKGVLIGESPTKPLEEALGSISQSVDGLAEATARASGASRRMTDEEKLDVVRRIQAHYDGDDA